jgi:hypothetical protein
MKTNTVDGSFYPIAMTILQLNLSRMLQCGNLFFNLQKATTHMSPGRINIDFLKA